jgi:hypothetical protein
LVASPIVRFRSDYGHGGQPVPYIYNRRVRQAEEIRDARTTLLFKELTEAEFRLVQQIHGRLTVTQLAEVWQQDADHDSSDPALMERFRHLLAVLHYQGAVFWIEGQATAAEIEAYQAHLRCRIPYHSSVAMESLRDYVHEVYDVNHLRVPAQVTFFVTGRCNARCTICGEPCPRSPCQTRSPCPHSWS